MSSEKKNRLIVVLSSYLILCHTIFSELLGAYLFVCELSSKWVPCLISKTVTSCVKTTYIGICSWNAITVYLIKRICGVIISVCSPWIQMTTEWGYVHAPVRAQCYQKWKSIFIFSSLSTSSIKRKTHRYYIKPVTRCIMPYDVVLHMNACKYTY